MSKKLLVTSLAACLLAGCNHSDGAPRQALGPFLGGAVHPAQVSAPARGFFPTDEAVGEFVRPYIDRRQARGIVVGLVEPDGSHRVLTFGDAGEGARPLGARSVFETGSIAKTFTGVVLADMVRRGEVKLDDPVAKYMPAGVRVPSRDGREITLLDLATHMSGLPRLPTGYVPPDDTDPFAEFAPADLYAFLKDHELAHAPGANFEYSNLGMGLLGHALALAVGADNFKALVTERVLRPLGMTMTVYGRPSVVAPWMTQGHDRQGAVAPYLNVDVLAGGGGLNSNVVDLMTYLDANIGEPTTPIESAMRDASRVYRSSPSPGVELGLGWLTLTQGGRTQIGHRGGSPGYSTYIAFDPETRAGVVVLANSGDFDHADFIGRRLLHPDRSLSEALSLRSPGSGRTQV